jgi:ABC-type multidrug transport system ATPase subunit
MNAAQPAIRIDALSKTYAAQGMAPKRALDEVSFDVPQELLFDPFFTPREALEIQAGMYGVPKAERITDALLAAVHLSDKADAYARTLSGGMKRRLLVAKAMVHSPPILILDEPTAGVDIELRLELWHYVQQINEEGTTILLTTHYLEEAEQLCDQIAFINHGEIAAQGSTAELSRQYGASSLEDAYLELVGRKELSRSRVEEELV